MRLIVRVARKSSVKSYNFMPKNTYGIRSGYYSNIGICSLVLVFKDNEEIMKFINDNCEFRDEAKKYLEGLSVTDRNHKYEVG